MVPNDPIVPDVFGRALNNWNMKIRKEVALRKILKPDAIPAEAVNTHCLPAAP
jgi:hypothetical protein